MFMRIHYRSNTIHLKHLKHFDSNVKVKLQGLKNFFKETTIVSWIQKTGSIKYGADGIAGQSIPDDDDHDIIIFNRGNRQ